MESHHNELLFSNGAEILPAFICQFFPRFLSNQLINKLIAYIHISARISRDSLPSSISFEPLYIYIKVSVRFLGEIRHYFFTSSEN